MCIGAQPVDLVTQPLYAFCTGVRALANEFGLPVLCTAGGRGLLPDSHPRCVNAARSAALKASPRLSAPCMVIHTGMAIPTWPPFCLHAGYLAAKHTPCTQRGCACWQCSFEKRRTSVCCMHVAASASASAAEEDMQQPCAINT